MDSKLNYKKNEGNFFIKGYVKNIAIRTNEDFAEACARILREYLDNRYQKPNKEVLVAYEFSRTIRGDIMRKTIFGKDLTKKLNNLNFIKEKNLI